MTSGTNNTSIGRRAARYIADGATAFTTSTNGIYIGDDCHALANSMIDEVVIGANVVGSGSYSTTIGSGGVFKFVSKSAFLFILVFD